MNDFTEILPDLWIGNKNSINNLTFLKENNFECIINCTKELEFNKKYTRSENIKLSINDNPTTELYDNNIDMYNKLDEIIKYIHHFLTDNKSVLVYCSAGSQRSATIIATYIMYYGKVSAKQAIEYIKTKRPICFEPKVNFYLALQKFEGKK